MNISNMSSIYRPILKSTWRILWRAKYLWFFGFLAILVMNSGEVNLIFNNYSELPTQLSFLENLKTLYASGSAGSLGQALSGLFAGLNWTTVPVLVLFLLVLAFFVWLVNVAEGGLFFGAYKEYRRQPCDFNYALKAGVHNFWKVLWFNILKNIIIYGSLIVVGLPLFSLYINEQSSALQLALILLLFVIFIPLSVVISFLIKYAIIYAVVKKESVSVALSKAWRLFIKNWIVSVEMAIVLFLVSLLVALLTVLAAVVLVLPMGLILYVINLLGVEGVVLTGAILSLIIFLLISFWLGAMLSTFHATAWVILFDKLNESNVYAKVLRVAESVFKTADKRMDKEEEIEE